MRALRCFEGFSFLSEGFLHIASSTVSSGEGMLGKACQLVIASRRVHVVGETVNPRSISTEAVSVFKDLSVQGRARGAHTNVRRVRVGLLISESELIALHAGPEV